MATDMSKEAMKLALEALEKHGTAPKDWACKECVPFSDILEDGFQCKYHGAITALRQALEQPAQQEPVALPEKTYEFVPTPEPAKWHHPECEGECIACLIERVVQEAYGSQGLSYLQRHLTSPPARRTPLTDEQIMAIGKELGLKCRLGGNPNIDFDYARAIETAHGIKENT